MADWQDPITLFLWLFGGFVILLILLLFMVLMFRAYIKRIRLEMDEKNALDLSYQQRLLVNSVTIQEHERARIAADLHDDLIAQLHRIKLMNQDHHLNRLLGESISTARRISHELTPPLIESLSLQELIQDFMEPLAQVYDCSFHKSIFTTNKLDKEQKLHLFRIIQELMSNIIKHAKASQIEILLRRTKSYTSLVIKDDGIGFEPSKSGGLGLQNIELRTQILQVSYRYKQHHPSGTITILLLQHH